MTKKNIIMPILVLVIICTVVAALLAGTNMLTKDKIKENNILKEQASLIEVLPTDVGFDHIYSASGEIEADADKLSDEIKASLPKTVKDIYAEKNGAGYVFIMSTTTQFSKGEMIASVGVAGEKVTGATITSYNETKDIGKDTYPSVFIGKTADDYGDVALVSGATWSSTAFREEIIGAALKASSVIISDGAEVEEEEEKLPKTDEELDALISKLVPGAEVESAELPKDAPETLKRFYSVKDDGYVAYIVVPGQYVPVATEALVHMGGDGTVKNINLLSWVVGHNVEPGDFADRFIGKDSVGAGNVELVTGATGTSMDFRTELDATLKVITALIEKNSLPKTEDELNALIDELVPGATVEQASIPDNAPETLKKLYRVKDKGYVAYIVVPGQYVPVATEALVHIGNGGVIKNINLLSWVVGHGVEPGNFADGFIGKDITGVGEVELVSGATGTSTDFRTELNKALEVINALLTKEGFFKTEEELNTLISNLVGGAEVTPEDLPDRAPATLKKLYSVKNNGFVAYMVVAGDYVPVATEALVHINGDAVIKNINLLSWVVGHGVEPGDFAKRFIGKTISDVDTVELVTEATGTSGDFKTELIKILEVVVYELPKEKEKRIFELVEKMIPNSGEIVKLELAENAPKTLVSLYQDMSGRGSVAYIVVPGEYVPVATEALVYFDEFGEIRDVDLRSWIVGHGVEPGDFIDGFIGKNAETLGEVELVSGATFTAKDFKDAVADAMPYIPVAFHTYRIVGAVILSVAVVAFVTCLVIFRKRRAGK